MVDQETYGETRDNQRTGSGDNKEPFEFGHWRVCLTWQQQARLTILRGFVMDYRDGETNDGAAAGDMEYARRTDSGRYVPIRDDDDLPC